MCYRAIVILLAGSRNPAQAQTRQKEEVSPKPSQVITVKRLAPPCGAKSDKASSSAPTVQSPSIALIIVCTGGGSMKSKPSMSFTPNILHYCMYAGALEGVGASLWSQIKSLVNLPHSI